MTEILDRLTAALADRYRIERELGQGGMATVYLAHDLKHDRLVAIKVLKPELAAVLGAERFIVEIKTTAALQHPHILPLFDSGAAGDEEGRGMPRPYLYYVMPYIQGETLRAKLDRETQFGIEEAVRITRDVADALDYAHRHGVVHRDIKPENILLHDGRPMVVDFGIALALSAAAGGRMTETGMSLGTPHYMSPEQATADKEISGRSDIYSLGSVLYEMLTGNPPHTGSSAQQIIMKIIAESVEPVTKYRKSVPPNVAAAVAKSLEKLPADRFASAKEFADALKNSHFTTATAAGSASPRVLQRQRRVVALLGGALLVMTAAAAWGLLRPSPPQLVSRYGLGMPPGQEAVGSGFVLLTSDGGQIIYAGNSAQVSAWQLYRKPRDRMEASVIPGTEGVTAAAISPDDAWLAVVQGGELRRMPIAGGASTVIATDVAGAPGNVVWLEDGSIVYTTQGTNGIMRIPTGGGAGASVWSSDSLLPLRLTPLPKSRGVFFQGCPAPCVEAGVWALEFGKPEAKLVVPDARVAFFVPPGYLAYVHRDQSVRGVRFDPSTLTTRGTPIALMDSVLTGSGVSPFFAVSASGKMVTRLGLDAASRVYELFWVDQAGRESRVDSSWTFRLTAFAGNYGWALSPDGTRLAIGVNTAAGDDIWIKPLPRGPASRVTFGTGPESRPRWRDASTITFVTPEGLAQKRADGTGTDSLLYRGLLDEGVVSPDKQWLVFRRGATSSSSGGRDIFGLRLGVDSIPTPLFPSPYDQMAIALSPDGRFLAYQSDETGQREIYLRPFPHTGDGKTQVSKGGGAGALWARDGKSFYYVRGDNMMMRVSVRTTPSLELGEPQALFAIPASMRDVLVNWYTPWDVSPDGRFIMARPLDGQGSQLLPMIVVENWFAEVAEKIGP